MKRTPRKDVVAAVTKNGWALEYASNKLRADREIVLAAVTESKSGCKQPASRG